MFWWRDKSLIPTGIRTPDRPARNLVNTHTIYIYLVQKVHKLSPPNKAQELSVILRYKKTELLQNIICEPQINGAAVTDISSV
jgi:hypothetical protein